MWFLEWGWEAENHPVTTPWVSSALGISREGGESLRGLGIPPLPDLACLLLPLCSGVWTTEAPGYWIPTAPRVQVG